MQVGVPQRRGVAELHVGVLLGEVDHERIEIAERGAEDEVGAVEVDHRFHRLGDGIGLGDVLLLDDGDVGDALENLHGDGVCLVPAEIIARADIDGTQRDVGGVGRADERHGQRRGGKAGGARLQKGTAGKGLEGHRGYSLRPWEGGLSWRAVLLAERLLKELARCVPVAFEPPQTPGLAGCAGACHWHAWPVSGAETDSLCSTIA